MLQLKPLLLLACLFALQLSKAQINQKTIDTKIEKATVFLNGAQINRTGKITITPGNSEIVFKGISPYINKQSIQVKAEGNFTVLAVTHKLNYLQEQAKQADLQKVEDQKDIVQDKINAENDMMAIYKNEETLLTKNQAIVAQNQVKFTVFGAAVHVRTVAGRGKVYRHSPGERNHQDDDSRQGQVNDTLPPFGFCQQEVHCEEGREGYIRFEHLYVEGHTDHKGRKQQPGQFAFVGRSQHRPGR